jgi:CDP-diacylglycerol--glycerol-3-phosphate 3-phosphatidyltransferase
MAFSIYQLKPHFQRQLKPLITTLIRFQISPNQITIFAMSLSVLFGGALSLYPQSRALWIGFPVFMLFRMALNAIDGMLANATNQKTHLGVLLNEIGDQISDVFLYLPFCLIAGINSLLVLCVVIFALLSEFSGVCAVMIGASRRFDGPMGKSDRAFVFGLVSVLLVFQQPEFWINFLLAITVGLSVWTLFNRIRSALRFSQTLD